MQTLKKILRSCNHQVPRCHLNRVAELHRQLINGTPYIALGGKRLHQYPQYIRFKIGRSWRMLYLLKHRFLEPDCLIHRQQFEQTLKRRSRQC